MKAVSLRRSHANPCGGSNAHGSERKRRRVLAESSDRLVQDPQEWRDWANLLPDLIEDISGRLLSVDVAEYLRFHAVCRPWRDLTADPHAAPLDSRFRPRNWALLAITPDGKQPRRHLLNLATSASLGVDLPPLSTHCHLCAADGLLVLYHRVTAVIRLLDPLSNAVTELPPITSVVDPAAVPAPRPPEFVFAYSQGAISRTVNGAAFDDSTTPPTLVLCLRGAMSNIVVAKPGDAHWTLVNEGQASYPMHSAVGRVLFHSLVSMGGRCYVSSPEGSVFLLELRPLPRLVEMVNQRCLADKDTIFHKRIVSFLFRASGGRKVMMVRYWRGMEHFGGVQVYDRKELFAAAGVASRFEVLEVDLTARSLVPASGLGGRAAVFIGLTHCVLVSTETFPSLAADAIYLGCLHQRTRRFSVYYINRMVSNRRTEPAHEFARDTERGIVPGAQPCNLDQYLVCYVDRVHSYGGACINHVEHHMN